MSKSDEPGSSPLPAAELAALADEQAPKPHPSLPDQPAPGSNVAYLSKVEHDQIMAIARGLGWFARPSEHEHRLQLERGRRR